MWALAVQSADQIHGQMFAGDWDSFERTECRLGNGVGNPSLTHGARAPSESLRLGLNCRSDEEARMKPDRKPSMFSNTPLAFFDSSIGELAVYPISGTHNTQLSHVLGESLESCDPKTFVRFLLRYICYPSTGLGEKRAKPESPSLSGDDIAKLGEDEIEEIADIYIENQPYLYRKGVVETATDPDGTKVNSFSYGETEHPRKDDESNVHYLHRLYVIREERDREQLERLRRSVMGRAHFSTALDKSIRDILSSGESMSKMLKGIRVPEAFSQFAQVSEAMKGLDPPKSFAEHMKAHGLQAKDFLPDVTPAPQVHYGDIARNLEKNRRAPFEDLGQHIDQLIDVESASFEFMVEMNKTQTAIACEIKASGESAARLSKLNIAVTVIIVVLTVCGLIVSWSFRGHSDRSNQALREYGERITGVLGDTAGSIVAGNESANSNMKDVLAQIGRDRLAQDRNFEKFLIELAKLTELQNEHRTRDRETIETLKRKIADLEAIVGDRVPIDNAAKGNP